MSVRSFHVVPGAAVTGIVAAARSEIVQRVRDAYLLHDSGATVNPPSHFLRFPAKPDARIIALPAALNGDTDVVGLKWIASFPANVAGNLARASAVLILNDYATGYPYACLEAAGISAARTAASAAVAARSLVGGRTAARVAFVGAGVIARTIVDFLVAEGWRMGTAVVHDRVDAYAAKLAGHLHETAGVVAETCDDVRKSVADCDLVVLATTAAEPYLTDPSVFAPGQVVLNISLRDLGPEVIVHAFNVLDDVEHCLTANTSPHLAEQLTGSRDFVDGTLADVLTGRLHVDRSRPIVFSPFGLGVLDLAVGEEIYRAAVSHGSAIEVPGFFADSTRWS